MKKVNAFGYMDCECCKEIAADYECKINGVGDSIFLCEDCIHQGDLDKREQLIIIQEL